MSRRLFGFPDGLIIRLRCLILGHYWRPCDDKCCDGGILWCDRCLGCKVVSP